jgi:hypothetical protein
VQSQPTKEQGTMIVPFSGWRKLPPRLLALSVPRLPDEEGVERAWSLRDVPGGEFSLRLQTRTAAEGALSVSLGQDNRPLRLWPLQPTGEQSFTLTLPGGADRLTLRFDPPTAQAVEDVRMSVHSIYPDTGQPLAIAGRTYGGVEVHFMDDQAFVEPEGFWIKAEQTARFMVVRRGAPKAIELELGNGASPNRLSLIVNQLPTTVSLAASEAGKISVPLDDFGRGVVTIHAPAGFRPSDSGGSSDNRYLGVHVRVIE